MSKITQYTCDIPNCDNTWLGIPTENALPSYIEVKRYGIEKLVLHDVCPPHTVEILEIINPIG